MFPCLGTQIPLPRISPPHCPHPALEKPLRGPLVAQRELTSVKQGLFLGPYRQLSLPPSSPSPALCKRLLTPALCWLQEGRAQGHPCVLSIPQQGWDRVAG